MLVIRTSTQQDARTATTNKQSATERPAVAGQPTKDELREQIRATIQAAQEAARDAEQAGAQASHVRDEANQVRVINGLPPVPAFPGQTVQRPIFGNNFIPDQAVSIANGFFVMCAVMVVGWPLARAFGRRMERGTQAAAIPPGMSEQLQRIEQAVDAMSIEVERISESQRFLAKLQSGQSVEPVALPGAERR
jgi:hypothetical protein